MATGNTVQLPTKYDRNSPLEDQQHHYSQDDTFIHTKDLFHKNIRSTINIAIEQAITQRGEEDLNFVAAERSIVPIHMMDKVIQFQGHVDHRSQTFTATPFLALILTRYKQWKTRVTDIEARIGFGIIKKEDEQDSEISWVIDTMKFEIPIIGRNTNVKMKIKDIRLKEFKAKVTRIINVET